MRPLRKFLFWVKQSQEKFESYTRFESIGRAQTVAEGSKAGERERVLDGV